jgi:hypothetical protein
MYSKFLKYYNCKTSDGYTENDTNAGYQGNFTGGTNSKKEREEIKSNGKNGFKIMAPRRRKSERERQIEWSLLETKIDTLVYGRNY